jgi:hypothetical protein
MLGKAERPALMSAKRTLDLLRSCAALPGRATIDLSLGLHPKLGQRVPDGNAAERDPLGHFARRCPHERASAKGRFPVGGSRPFLI